MSFFQCHSTFISIHDICLGFTFLVSMEVVKLENKLLKLLRGKCRPQNPIIVTRSQSLFHCKTNYRRRKVTIFAVIISVLQKAGIERNKEGYYM